MDKIILLASVLLFVSAIRCHAITHAHVKTKIEKAWYDRLWSGSRPTKENLTEQGL